MGHFRYLPGLIAGMIARTDVLIHTRVWFKSQNNFAITAKLFCSIAARFEGMSGAKIYQAIRRQTEQTQQRIAELESQLAAAQAELEQVRTTVDQVSANMPAPAVPAP